MQRHGDRPPERAAKVRGATPRAPSMDPSQMIFVGRADPRTLSSAAVLHLQRTAGNSAVVSLLGDDDWSPVLDVVGKGGGSPLEPALRDDMERQLGADFSDVRVHTDPQAAASATAVQARAYTVGNEIVFGHGAYAPATAEGKHTLAHELTHVVQQRKGPVPGTDTGTGIAVSDPADPFEQQAEATAREAMTARGALNKEAVGAAGSTVVAHGSDNETVQRIDEPQTSETGAPTIQDGATVSDGSTPAIVTDSSQDYDTPPPPVEEDAELTTGEAAFESEDPGEEMESADALIATDGAPTTSSDTTTPDTPVQALADLSAAPNSRVTLQRQTGSQSGDPGTKQGRLDYLQPIQSNLDRLWNFVVGAVNGVAAAVANLGQGIATSVASAIAGPIGATVANFLFWLTNAKKWIKNKVANLLLNKFKPLFDAARAELVRALSVVADTLPHPGWIDWCRRQLTWLKDKYNGVTMALAKIPVIKKFAPKPLL